MTALSPQRAIPGDTGRLRYGDTSNGSPSGVTAAKGIIQRAFRYFLTRSLTNVFNHLLLHSLVTYSLKVAKLPRRTPHNLMLLLFHRHF